MNAREERDAWRSFVAVLVVVLTVVALNGQCACSPSDDSHIENVTTAGSYASQLTACVNQAKTLAESQACRCEVNRRYRRDCDDAGDLYTRDGGR